MLITMLNGCVQSEVNKKHAFEDTVEKKIAPLCDRSRKLSLQSNKRRKGERFASVSLWFLKC